ncbi:MAG: diaminopimelate decarboxylase [Gammaproteobacteria bacterium]|nr:diaminopimelate decarboxylase [Gammaproteobacteria bacterium]
MDFFNFKNGALHAENVSLETIAQQHGTPCYVYSRATLERHWHAFDVAFGKTPHLICYAVKANSNLAVLNLFARLGSGFDIVSIGELERVLAAGGVPEKIVFSGVGKQAHEIQRALEIGIKCFNVESEAELAQIQLIAARLNKQAPISIRVNPDVDAQTHPYISTGLKENKFGIDINEAARVYRDAQKMPNIRIEGVDCHIGSQLTRIAPYMDALDRVLSLVANLKTAGIHLTHLDIGGGLGIRYDNETPPLPRELIEAVLEKVAGLDMQILMEPGRAIVGNAGVLLTRVEYLKHNQEKHFAIVDAAMNDLVRPTLYDAWQDIVPVQLNSDSPAHTYDVVGPICETGDFLGKERLLSIKAGDLLAIRSAGAYGFAMSSNYNSRPRAAEIMVDDETLHVVRARETIAELFAHEHILPEA